MKNIFVYIKEFWKTNLIVAIALFTSSLFYLHYKGLYFSAEWIITTIILPYIISCIANISTVFKQNEKLGLFEKRDMDMNSKCSEIIGFLKSSINKKINENDLKHLLSQIKQLQSTIIHKENTNV